jgi:hypothetical protein
MVLLGWQGIVVIGVLKPKATEKSSTIQGIW